MKVYKIISPDTYNHGNKIHKYESPTGFEIISDKIKAADNFFTRLFGLIFKRKLKNSEGLLIEECKSIHTFGMRYCIDVIFLDKFDEIIKVFHSFKPFRFTPLIKNASRVLELKSGFINYVSLKTGDRLYIEYENQRSVF
ncbi:MAG: DUF192 domain-containing protein [Actinobacteria bacterium]|nr:DUF192 domain-containing protein [Actinomycetota bacterium]